jgi:hypothetical protein
MSIGFSPIWSSGVRRLPKRDREKPVRWILEPTICFDMEMRFRFALIAVCLIVTSLSGGTAVGAVQTENACHFLTAAQASEALGGGQVIVGAQRTHQTCFYSTRPSSIDMPPNILVLQLNSKSEALANFRGLLRLTNPKVRVGVRPPRSASSFRRPKAFSLDGVAGFYNLPSTAPSSGPGATPTITVEFLALRDGTVVSVMVTKSMTPISAAQHGMTDVLHHMNS